MKSLELLAPAKNLECGLAAVNCGADAVYIGADKFSARAQAGNSLRDIAALIAHAHKYYAKVYAAVNTIFTDRELEDAAELIRGLYNEGVDAVILQDMGLLEMDLPPIPLIASTQMHNATPERVLFLEKAGFSRAILARELSLEEIRGIRAQTTLELEAFVHGALCVCYSGQCYLSLALGGRSGNRGVCAQPCRKPYQLLDKTGKACAHGHLLSLKDLNLSDHLKELIDAGITSFKIEGRLKEADYVMNVTAFYRQRIDALLEGRPWKRASSGKVYYDFTPDPAKTFSRGFTTYFLNGRDKEMASHGTPQSIGEYVGRVRTLSSRSFTLESHREISSGDGICFFDGSGQLKGTQIFLVNGEDLFFENNEGLRVGAQVYRNFDRMFQKRLKAAKTHRKIGLKIELERKGPHLVLFAKDEDDIEAVQEAEIPLQAARDSDKACLTLKKQLTSFGETEFETLSLDIRLTPMEFVPIKQLNALRRGLTSLLQQARQRLYPRKAVSHAPNNVPYPVKTLDYRANVLNQKAKAFCRRHGVIAMQDALEKGETVPSGTVVMATRYCVLHSLELCSGKRREVAQGGPYALVDERGRRFELEFACQACRMMVCAPNA
jgi:23S rRNA 5-hydroxycytidine C2501 synthase